MKSTPAKKKSTPKSSSAPFFSVSMDAIDLIVSMADPLASLITYLIICSGIDNKKPLSSAGNKFSTHAEKSVRDRSNLLTTSEVRAALRSLCEKGFFIDKRPEDTKFLPGVETFEITRIGNEESLNISKLFFEKISAKHGASKEIASKFSDLFDVCRSEFVECNIGISQARLDALIIFLRLLKNQDFKKYSGLDPRIFSEKLSFCNDKEILGDFPVQELLKEAGDWELSFVHRSEKDKNDLKNISLLLKDVWCYEKTEATLLQRAKHAFVILNKAKLIYDSYILWDSDPKNNNLLNGDGVIATIYVSCPSSDNMEKFASHEIDKILVENGLANSSDFWKYNEITGKSSFLFSKSDVYRYLVPKKLLNKWLLLRQLRVRCWTSAQNDSIGINEDERRTKGYLTTIKDAFFADDT